MLKTVYIFLVLIVTTFGVMHAQSCNQGSSLASQMWQSLLDEEAPVIDENYTEHILNDWAEIANDSDATIGAQLLVLQKKKTTGSLHGKTKTTFAIPPAQSDTITINLSAMGKNISTDVVICLHDAAKRVRQVASYSLTSQFNEHLKPVVLTDVKSKIITIALVNNTIAHKMEYAISAQ